MPIDSSRSEDETMPQDSPETEHEQRPRLCAYLADTVAFDAILAVQRRLIYELEVTGDAGLILCEHTGGVTVGRGGSLTHIRTVDENGELTDLAPRFVARGGGCWLHTPGQLAGYLIGDLGRLAKSADDYLYRFESALIESLADFDVKAVRDERHSGLFAGGKRIAALGLAVTRNMVHYGFLLNVGPWLRQFEVIAEPGADHKPVRQTSMESVRGRPVEASRLRSRLIERIREEFVLEAGPVVAEADWLTSYPEVFESYVCR